jgi:hypothetical protein
MFLRMKFKRPPISVILRYVVVMLVGALVSISIFHYRLLRDYKTIDKLVGLEGYAKAIKDRQIMRAVSLDNSSIDNLTLLFLPTDTIQLKFFLDSTRLVYKFSYLDCSSCNDAQFKLLSDLKRDYAKLPVLILFDFDGMQSLRFHTKRWNAFKLVGVRDFSVRDHSYFILNQNGRATNFYLPDVNDNSLSKSYLETITKILAMPIKH